MKSSALPSNAQFENLVEQGDPEALQLYLDALAVEEIGYAINRLGVDEKARLLSVLAPTHSDLAATLIDHVEDREAARLLSDLPPAAAAAIVKHLDSDDRADVLGAIEPEQAQLIIGKLEPAAAREVERLVHHAADTAGGLMITEYLAHPASASVSAVLDDLRDHAEDYARYDVQYVYVTDVLDRLVGVIRLRDLVLTPGDRTLSTILIRDPKHVAVGDPQTHLEAFFDEHGYFAAPVVDESGVLVGVVRRAAVQEAHAEQAGRALLAFGGIIGGEELRSMPTAQRIVRRLMFLVPNILLNLLAATVVAAYEPTIAAVTALAVFLPMLSDMSGCAGNQAVAVTIRELSVGLVKPRDLMVVLSKEALVGVVNGTVLGTLVGGIAWVMRGNEWPLIGFVVGGAMCANAIFAVLIGGTVPLVLKRSGIDPALAASPILTTFTDIFGFFLTLALATAVLL